MTVAPKSVTGEEFPELLSLLNQVFGRDVQPGIEILYPTLFRPSPDTWDNLRIIRTDGKIVSHVAIHPQEAVVEETSLKLGWVGAVATHSEYRSRGYASTLMKDAVRKMREEQYDLSLLGGFRDYYGRFGYEIGGAEHSFLVFLRGLRSERRTDCRKWQFDSDPADLDRIIAAHEVEPLRVRRPPACYSLLLGVPTRQVFCAEEESRFAYVVLGKPRFLLPDGQQAAVVDYGGDCELVLELLGHLLSEGPHDRFWVYTPAARSPVRDTLLRVGQEYYCGPFICIRVLHLRRLLEKLQPLMNRRLHSRDSVVCGSVGLEVSDGDGSRESVSISFAKDGVSISAGSRGGPVIQTDLLRLVQLLFGLDTPGRWCPWLDRKAARLLDQVLPLDFYVFQMDHV